MSTPTPLPANADESIGALYGSTEQQIDPSKYQDPQQYQQIDPQQVNEQFEIPSECSGAACTRATGVAPPPVTQLSEGEVVIPDTVDGKQVASPVIVVKPTVLENKFVRLTLWLVLFFLILCVLFVSFKKFKK